MIVYVLFCASETVKQFIGVYSTRNEADLECDKRNEYESFTYGDHSSWVYIIEEHCMNQKWENY